MLQNIRDKTSGLIAMVIVGLLIITFAFWGVSYYFDQGGEVVAVKVNDAEIDLREYQRVYQNVRRQWQEIAGDDAVSIDDEIVKQQTLDGLVDRELVNQLNDSMNLRVSVQQVRSLINGIETFQGINGFDSYQYERAVAQLGFTPVMFEFQVREDMKAEQLQSALVESAFVTREEVMFLAGLQSQTRDFSYSIISSDELKEQIAVSDEEINEYYERNIQNYLEPEQVRIAYIDLSLQLIAQGVEVNEDELRSYYEANRANYDVEDQRKIRHITISISENAGEEEIAGAKAKAESLIALLKNGMSFDELSEKYSGGADYKIEMSELGFLTRGIMAPEIDEVMFTLEEGAISEPIVTEKSVDVIRVDGIKGGTKNKFENVREQVEEVYRLSLAENEFFEISDQLANLTYEHPDTLDIAAEELALDVMESEFFNRASQSDPLLADNKIKTAAFSDEALNGNNSDMLEVGENRVIVLRVIEHVAEQRKPLEDVRERVITRMKFEQASAEVREKGEAILEKLRAGKDAEEIADETGIVWTNSTAIRRDNSGINRAVVRTAFQLGRPADGQAVFGGSSLGSGDYALVILEKVNDPDPASIQKEILDNIRVQLQQVKANTLWQQMVDNARAQSKVTIFSERL